MIALHLLIAGAGMWIWARSLGLREPQKKPTTEAVPAD